MALTQTHIMGYAAKLNRNTGTTASPTYDEIANVMDLTVSDTMDEADVSARLGSGWGMSEPSLQHLEISFDMIGDYGDADFVALQTAYYARTAFLLVTSSKAPATSGSQGIKNIACKIFEMSKSEALGEVTKFSFKLKPTLAYESGSVVVPVWFTAP